MYTGRVDRISEATPMLTSAEMQLATYSAAITIYDLIWGYEAAITIRD